MSRFSDHQLAKVIKTQFLLTESVIIEYIVKQVVYENNDNDQYGNSVANA